MLNETHGDFTVIKKLGKNDAGKMEYGCWCSKCKTKDRFTKRQLLKQPKCSECAEPVAKTKQLKPIQVSGSDEASRIADYLKKPISEDVEEQIENLFGIEAQEIAKLLETADRGRGVEKFNATVFVRCMELIGVAEAAYRERANQPNAYALTNIIGQCRELLNDLQMGSDAAELPSQILQEVIMPEFRDLGLHMINQMFYLKKALSPSIKEGRESAANDEIDAATKDMAHYVETLFSRLRTKMIDFIGK